MNYLVVSGKDKKKTKTLQVSDWTEGSSIKMLHRAAGAVLSLTLGCKLSVDFRRFYKQKFSFFSPSEDRVEQQDREACAFIFILCYDIVRP